MNVDVSIIIVSYNVVDYLKKCLLSLFSNPTRYKFEVLITDNASTDGSRDIINKQFPDVHWIQNSQNLGFATANNQAINQSLGRYIWLLNPDTMLVNDALSPLVEFMDERPQAAACGSRLLNPDGSLQPSCYPFPTLGREFSRLFHLDSILKIATYPMQQWNIGECYEVDNIQGASLLIRKSVLDQIGLLDDSFFMYTEEVDLNYRLKNAGWKNYWIPRSEIIHFGGQSTKQNQTEMFLQLYKTKIQFFQKHYGKTNKWFYKLILFLASISRIVISPLGIFLSQQKAGDQKLLVKNYRHLLENLSQY